MFLLMAASDAENIRSIIIWIVIVILITIAFGLSIHYIARTFTHRVAIAKVTAGNGREYSKKTYYKIGSEVIVKKVRLPKGYETYKAYKIKSDSDIENGSLVSFAMPKKDVVVYFKKNEEEKKKSIKKETSIKMKNLPLPEYIKEKSDREVIPVILMGLDDVKTHIRESNAKHFFPIVNSYKCAKSEDRDVLILYNGDLIYAVLIYSDITFKIFVKSDNHYVNEELGQIDSIVKVKDDVFSFILDYAFDTKEQFFTILDHAYEYVLYISYVRNGQKYSADELAAKKANRDMLSLNIEISREFDPVFDKAIAEAKKYKKHQENIKIKLAELDQPLVTSKKNLIKEIEGQNEYINPHKVDDYLAPINITEGKYIEPSEPQLASKVTLPDIFESLNDLPVLHPMELAFDKIVDYIMLRKDMVSLTIDVPVDLTKEMATMKFISSTFALISLKDNSYVAFLRLDDKYVKHGFGKRKHKSIRHVRNGEEEDWYRITLDNSFESYEEIYEVFLKSYDYTKACYYKRYS